MDVGVDVDGIYMCNLVFYIQGDSYLVRESYLCMKFFSLYIVGFAVVDRYIYIYIYRCVLVREES